MILSLIFLLGKVEMNPVWQQKKLREFCKEKGILISVYSPLGGKGTLWGTNLVMDCECLKQIAHDKGKTHAQVLVVIFFLLLLDTSLRSY